MKKVHYIVLFILLLLFVTGCGESDNTSTIDNNKDVSNNSDNDTSNATASNNDNDAVSDTLPESYDVDLTKLSSTMVYSQVYNMMVSPDDYLGKKIKMRGNFSVYQDQTTHKIYYACLIADATACCSQGIEFELEGDYSYPDDYPELNSIITVSGIFDTYEENGYLYCRLINAKME